MQKKDKLWIRWIHTYYVKGRDVMQFQVPNQASWMIRKILGAHRNLQNVPRGSQLLSSCSFFIRVVYKALRGKQVSVSWKKLICNNPSPPNSVFVGWLAIQGRLATCDRLAKFGIHHDPLCILCKRENETIDHLIFSCPFSAEVWQGMLKWKNHHRCCHGWSQEVQIATPQLYTMAFTVATYHIWKERNSRKFQNCVTDVPSLIRRI